METRSQKDQGKEPIVSVIIPTYNRAHLVGRAIRGVLSQTFQDWELIVVDDGSTDNTEEVVRSFSDSRIQYVRHNVNRGGSAARNTGIRTARGEFIAFLDSDDEWLPEKLEKQLNIFRNWDREVGVVYTGVILIDEESGRQRIKTPRCKGMILEEELAYNPVGSASRVMVRRECFNEVGGFDESLPSCQDWDMWIRLAEKYKFDYVDEPLVKHFEHGRSISANPDSVIAGRQMLWAKYGIERSSRQLRGLHYFRLGHQLCYYGAMSAGRHYLFKALLTEPWQFRNVIGLLLSFLGAKLYKKITFSIMGIIK